MDGNMKEKDNSNTQTEEQKTKKNKALNTVVNIILVVTIIFGIFCAFTAFVSKSGSGVPNILGVEFFAIQSDSMHPTFNKGDLVVDFVVKNPETLKKDDIITFWTSINGEKVLNSHRIVEVKDYDGHYSFVTKGDNAETNTRVDDMEVHQSSVVGKYLFHIPKLGSFIDFLQEPKGFLFVIVLPVALFFIWQLVQFFRSLFAYQAEKVKIQYQQMAANGVANPNMMNPNMMNQGNMYGNMQSQPNAPNQQYPTPQQFADPQQYAAAQQYAAQQYAAQQYAAQQYAAQQNAAQQNAGQQQYMDPQQFAAAQQYAAQQYAAQQQFAAQQYAAQQQFAAQQVPVTQGAPAADTAAPAPAPSVQPTAEQPLPDNSVPAAEIKPEE